jgi:hypothetical protein
MTLRGLGINYDTGFFPGGTDSRPGFDPAAVRRDMAVIARDLHCTAVRVSGGDPGRLSVAAAAAKAEGLETWFAPFPCELGTGELRPLLAECAERAATAGSDVLVLGCEMSLFSRGFLPGDTVFDRIELLTCGHAGRGGAGEDSPGETAQLVNTFLAEAAADARRRFPGRLTYAAGLWEDIDWAPFDIVAADAYRDESTKAFYPDMIGSLVTMSAALGKPFAATEFGCCTYEGAADRGGMGWAIVDDTTDPPRIKGDYRRSEAEQVAYLTELLATFDAHGVDSAFWFTFATFTARHAADPARDLDLGAYGLVKMLDGEHWEPKEGFHALAAEYARRR